MNKHRCGMAAAELVVQKIKDVTVVNFQDSSMLEAHRIEQIAQQLYHLVDDENRRKMVLDFTGVKFLSSTALGVLINLQKKAAGAKGEVVICGLRDELGKIFKITNLNKLFKFHPDEESALQYLGVFTR